MYEKFRLHKLNEAIGNGDITNANKKADKLLAPDGSIPQATQKALTKLTNTPHTQELLESFLHRRSAIRQLGEKKK